MEALPLNAGIPRFQKLSILFHKMLNEDPSVAIREGRERALEVQDNSEYQEIPIIAVTGYSEYDDRARALQSGFNAHLTKPIDPAELLNLMQELLGQNALQS